MSSDKRWLDAESGVPDEVRDILRAAKARDAEEQTVEQVRARLAGILVAPVGLGHTGGSAAPDHATSGLHHVQAIAKAVLTSVKTPLLLAGIVGASLLGAHQLTRIETNRASHEVVLSTHATKRAGTPVRPSASHVDISSADPQAIELRDAPNQNSAASVSPDPIRVQSIVRGEKTARGRIPRLTLPRSARQRSPLVRETANGPDHASSELELLGRAQTLAALFPDAALRIMEQHAREYPNGAFAQEREVLAIETLISIGRVFEARDRAERFIDAFANSAYEARLRKEIEEASKE